MNKSILSILVAAALGASLSATAAHAQSTFPDVPDNHWAAQAVRRLAEAGIIEGFPATAEKARPVAEAPSLAPASVKSVARRATSAARSAAAVRSARVAVR